MRERLEAASPDEYLVKLLACRTSKNGVFGAKIHSVDFQEAILRFPELLERLAPVTYIYIERQDKVAQAVSMARAAQTGAWVSLSKAKTENLHYNSNLIAKCLEFVERQNRDWVRWFDAHSIEPIVVFYEDLVVDGDRIVRGIVERMGVQNDDPQVVRHPNMEKQGDETNEEWVARFRSESASTAVGVSSDAAGRRTHLIATEKEPATNVGKIMERPNLPHVFDRYAEIKDATARPIGAVRLRHRYSAIVERNRELFQNARVLDIHCGDGRWTLAAIDAGATHVVGVEPRREPLQAARHILIELGVEPVSFELINSKIVVALRTFLPEAFDLILCEEFSKIADPHLFFNQLRRLRPKYVILDTEIIVGKVPIVTFRIARNEKAGPSGTNRHPSMIAVPNHELIRMLCDYFGFRWRVVDWHALGIADWTGVHDYEQDRRRTYVLERIVR